MTRDLLHFPQLFPFFFLKINQKIQLENMVVASKIMLAKNWKKSQLGLGND